MIRHLLLFVLFACTAYGAAGDYQFLKENATGPSTTIRVTPNSNDVLGWSGATLTNIPRNTLPGYGAITSLSGDVVSTGSGAATSVVGGLNGVNLAGLTTGLLKNTTGTGVPSIAIPGVDYLTGNQTITLSGDVSGSGSTSITVSIGSGRVTSDMLAGSIALGKIAGGGATSGQYMTWNGTSWTPTSLNIASSYGGNGTADADKLAKFGSDGSLQTYAGLSVFNAAGQLSMSPGGISFIGTGGSLTLESAAMAAQNFTTNVTVSIPQRNGTIILDSDTGTVTNAMLAGSIALSKIAQGGATSNQVLSWNGTAWAPVTPFSGLTAVNGTSNQVTASTSGSVVTVSLVASPKVTGGLTLGNTSSIAWGDGSGSGTAQGTLASAADGVFVLADSTGSGSPSVVLGAATSSGGIKLRRSGSTLLLRVGDDSSYAALNAASITTNAIYSLSGSLNVGVSSGTLAGGDGSVTVDWNNRLLYTGSSVTSVDWGNRALKDTAGATQVSWSTAGVQFPNLTASSLAALDSSNNLTAATVGSGLSYSSGTLSVASGGISNAMLTHSSITLAGTSTSLGGSITMSTMLDSITTTRGSILFRGSSGWSFLTPGTSGLFFQTQGAGVDPTWATASWTSLSNKPTTLAGYGITDAQPLNTTLTNLSGLANGAGLLQNDGRGNLTWFSSITLAGYGIVDAQPLSMNLSKISTLANAAGYLYNNGSGTFSYATPSLGLTIGTTIITSGTSGRILYDNAGVVGELTTGTGVATAIGNAVNGSGGLLTYSIIGTSGSTVPLLNTANTFASGQTFGATSGDYIALASSSTRQLRLFSNYAALGSSAWAVGEYDNGSLSPAAVSTLYFDTNCAVVGNLLLYSDIEWNDGTVLNKAARDVLLFRDYYTTTNSCTFLVVNTYSSSTSYEAAGISWSSNVALIGSQVGSGGGTARDVQLVRGGTTKVTVGANVTSHAQPVKLASYTVSTLPSASTCGAGACAFVTDATSQTPYTTASGGGSYKAMVISDGTNWIIH
jgi:hypothetical protein